jgi:hypothetical protein
VSLQPLRGLCAVLLALACVACGGHEQIGFGGAPPPSTPGDPPTTATPAPLPPGGGDPLALQPPPGSIPVPAAQVDASALPPGYPTVVWTTGGADLGVYGQAGGCVQAAAEATEQGPGRVAVRITETTTSTGPCTMEISYPPLAVALDAPLGQRSVVLTRLQVGPG